MDIRMQYENGVRTYESFNWIGMTCVIPRDKVKESASFIGNRTGFYFLIGGLDSLENKREIYVGETEDLLNRLKKHVRDKDYWVTAICFYSKLDNLNKAHIKYLEATMYERASKVSDYYIVANGNSPTKSHLSIGDQRDIEEFASYVNPFMECMGYRSLEMPNIVETSESMENLFYINNNRGADATGRKVPDGFEVFKDSTITSDMVVSILPHTAKHRQRLIEDGIIAEIDGKLTFTTNHVFKSPSAASAITLGRESNGKLDWKNKDGVTLRDLEETE